MALELHFQIIVYACRVSKVEYILYVEKRSERNGRVLEYSICCVNIQYRSPLRAHQLITFKWEIISIRWLGSLTVQQKGNRIMATSLCALHNSN